MNVKIQPYHIAAIHRIGKSYRNNSKNVILGFTSRKNAVLTLKNRPNLKSSNKGHYKKRVGYFERLLFTAHQMKFGTTPHLKGRVVKFIPYTYYCK